VYGAALLLSLWMANETLFLALVREQYSAAPVNRVCELANNSDEPLPLRLSRRQLVQVCEALPSDLSVKRFVLFASDCWPLGEAGDVLEHFGEHAVAYGVDIPGAKYSHGIWTSYLTGQLPTNYKGDVIGGDHFLRALNRHAAHAHSVQYVGPLWSYLALLGHDNVSNPLLADVRLEPEPLDVSFEHAHPWFFERTGFMQEYFRALVKHGRSVISHSAVFDHRQHGEHRALGAAGVDFPHTKKLARRVQADFKTLKAWFDSNPDYTLILYSDHGVDEYVMGQYFMHGQTRDGNEPFLMLYNARFKPAPGVQRIDVVDVLPTLVQYFAGVDIPANSMGISYTHVDNELSVHDLRIAARNALQLHRSATMRSVVVDTARLEALLQDAVAIMERPEAASANSTAAVHGALREWLVGVKQSMYGVMHPPWKHALAAALLAMLCTLFIVVTFNPRLELFIARNEVRRFAWEIARIFGTYTAPFTQLLYIYEGWLATHQSGTLWRLMAPLLSLILLRALDAVPPASALVARLRRTVYRSAFVVLAATLVSDSFHELVGLLNEEWAALLLGRPLVFLLSSRVLWAYYMRAIDARAVAWRQLQRSAVLLGDERRARRLAELEQRSTARLQRELLAAGALLLSAFLFVMTSASLGWYGGEWTFGLHVHPAALVVFVGAGALLPLWLLTLGSLDACALNGEALLFGGAERLVVPLNILIFVLNVDSVTNQALLALVNWQLLDVAVPLVQATKQLYAHSYASMIARNPDAGGSQRHLQGVFCVAHQAAAMLAYVTPFWASSVLFKDVVNFDVHPFSGRVGMTDYDTFPLLSAAMMLVHKYGIFMLFCVYSLTMVRLPDTYGPEARLRELAPPPPAGPHESAHDAADRPSTRANDVAIDIDEHEHADVDVGVDDDDEHTRPEWVPSAPLVVACVQRHELLLDLLSQQLIHVQMTALMLLQSAMTSVGLFAMMCLLSSKHAREEALSQSLLCACICAVHCVLRLHFAVVNRITTNKR
jgi:hypothetical protein